MSSHDYHTARRVQERKRLAKQFAELAGNAYLDLRVGCSVLQRMQQGRELDRFRARTHDDEHSLAI